MTSIPIGRDAEVNTHDPNKNVGGGDGIVPQKSFVPSSLWKMGQNFSGQVKVTHTFSQLVGSNHAQFIGYDANGVEVTDFKLDYIGSGFATPSGYASAGVIGGDVASVAEWSTSLAYNLNQTGYCAGGDCGILGMELTAVNDNALRSHPNSSRPGILV